MGIGIWCARVRRWKITSDRDHSVEWLRFALCGHWWLCIIACFEFGCEREGFRPFGALVDLVCFQGFALLTSGNDLEVLRT